MEEETASRWDGTVADRQHAQDPKALDGQQDVLDEPRKLEHVPFAQNAPDPRTHTYLRLLGMPLDVLGTLFEHLEPVTAVCLGVTCKALYSVLRKIHGKVTLYSAVTFQPWYRYIDFISNSRERRLYLHEILEQWMGPLYEMDWFGSRKFYRARLVPDLELEVEGMES